MNAVEKAVAVVDEAKEQFLAGLIGEAEFYSTIVTRLSALWEVAKAKEDKEWNS